MLCPHCNKEAENEVYCPNCGKRIDVLPSMESNIATPIVLRNKPRKPTMIFNIIFAIWLMVTYMPSTTGLLSIFFEGDLDSMLIGLIIFGTCAFIITTAILLIMRKPLGYIFQFFVNIIGIIISAGIFSLCIWAIFATDTPTEYEKVLNIFVDMFSGIIAVFMLPLFGMHTAGLIYYIVNKKVYFKPNEDDVKLI